MKDCAISGGMHIGTRGRKGGVQPSSPTRCYCRENAVFRQDSGYFASASFTAALSMFNVAKQGCLCRNGTSPVPQNCPALLGGDLNG